MGVHGWTKAMKWILIFFNALILCAGAIAIGLGAWGLASQYGAEKIKELTGSELYRGSAIAIIVGGSIMVFISFLGFVGALFENRLLLGLYFIITILLLILFVVSAAVAFTYRDSLKDQIMKQMNDTLMYQYGNNGDLTNVWDNMQQDLQCCGVYGRTPNSSQSWYMWQQSTWFNTQNSTAPKMLVPVSCCNTNYANLSTCVYANTDAKKPVQTNYTQVTSEGNDVYYKGCFDRLTDEVREHILAIGGISIAIIATLFFSILFSICVWSQIRSHKMVV
uniref:Tetraspanin n=1 Tax=Arion vulgaris TaxID=1028688 RepID=A0A0B7A437_9EUPU